MNRPARPHQPARTDSPPAIRPERRWWHEIPMGLFYVPIGLAVTALSLRHLSPLAAMKANTGLAKGGLFPASKQDFFDLFPADSPLIPVSMKLEPSMDEVAVTAAFDRFVKQIGHSPRRFVLKPDDGIQGQNIQFFSSLDELLTFWLSPDYGDGDWLLQEYIGGLEVALFYNQPDAAKPGRVLSMTLKHGFEIIGDGKSNIGELIEAADADKATKRQVTKTNQHRLGETPPINLSMDLIEVRNHHLGATFQDISDWITPELETGLCTHLDPIEGFQYGRLDCRVPDFSKLQNGKSIKALEINALYSEAVHAYDPKYGLWDAYRIFIDHWYQAIKTGVEN